MLNNVYVDFVVKISSMMIMLKDTSRDACFDKLGFKLVMAAVRSRCGHYIFALWFLLSSFFLSFFPRLISSAADWMSTIP